MSVKVLEKSKPKLATSRDEAQRKISAQLEKGKRLPNVSINENDDAKLWYEYTEELLRQLFTTGTLADEFVGMGAYDMDISTKRYLRTLKSIHDRLDLFPEDISPATLRLSPTSMEALDRLAARFHRVVRLLEQRHNGQ